MASPVAGFVGTHAKYPPSVVSHPIPIGYVQDVNRIGYSRDIGRSSIFGGQCYYIFGDTFCKNSGGGFIGITSNTAAIVPDWAHPLETKYLGFELDEKVEPLLPLTEQEILQEQNGVRVVLWAFGGIVETFAEVGWIWYQKSVIDPHNGSETYHGVGIARISRAARPQGHLMAYRLLDSMLFRPDEPRMGTFSALVHEDFVYLWGDHHDHILLARVPKRLPTTRHAYQFWNGHTYVNDWREATPVLRNMQQGCFFHSALFGPERPWCFVGCTNEGDSMVMMGAEASLEGPWSLHAVYQTDGINEPDKYRYCMYGHPWAFNANAGELLVTCSEHWPGGVVGARVQLVMEDAYFWQRVLINNYSNQEHIRRLVAPWCESARNLDPSCNARIRLEGRYVAGGFTAPPGIIPLCLRVESTDEETVRAAVEGISILLSLDERLREEGGERGSPGGKGGKKRSGRVSRVFSRVFRRGSGGGGGGAAHFSI